jgi:hypothetical protein
MSALHLRRGIAATLLTLGLAGAALVAASSAQAGTVHHLHRHGWHGRHASLGTTTVTTAPGIAGTLLKARILPLPVPGTRFGLSLRGGLSVSYGFPITGDTADLANGTGDITHSGGIDFVSRGASLEIGRFDIDLAAGKIFATQVNFAPARIPVLDLDLSGASVTTRHGCTTVSGVSLNLDPAAAGALNATFGTALPTDGSLTFGSAVVRITG